MVRALLDSRSLTLKISLWPSLDLLLFVVTGSFETFWWLLDTAMPALTGACNVCAGNGLLQ